MRTKLLIVFVLLIATVLTVIVSQKQQNIRQRASTISTTIAVDNATQVVDLMNNERSKVGLPSLKSSSLLSQAANLHNQKMNECATSFGISACFEHVVTQLNEPDLLTRIQQTGYQPVSVSENIARGQPTPADAVQAWMESTEGHKEAILNNGRWPDVGCAFLDGLNGTISRFYWTCDFGSTQNQTPLVPIPPPTVFDADIDKDGCVGILDFNTWFQAFKNGIIRTGTFPDINKDQSVDLLDFNLWLRSMISLPKDKLC